MEELVTKDIGREKGIGKNKRKGLKNEEGSEKGEERKDEGDGR